MNTQNPDTNTGNNGGAANNETDLILAQLRRHCPSVACEIICEVIDKYIIELHGVIQTHNQIASDAEVNMEVLADALRKLKIQTETALNNKRNGIPNNPKI